MRDHDIESVTVIYANDHGDSAFVVTSLVSRPVGGRSVVRVNAMGVLLCNDRIIQVAATRPISRQIDATAVQNDVEAVLASLIQER